MPGKEPNKEKGAPLALRIPEPLLLEVKTLLLDPKTGRVKYGAMSSLVERLFREWLREVRAGERNPEIEMERDDDEHTSNVRA